jgi:hypothetical protein
MIKRLEQVAALVVAAGLAIVSYWLFFSWAQGGGGARRPRRRGRRAGKAKPGGRSRRSGRKSSKSLRCSPSGGVKVPGHCCCLLSSVGSVRFF